MAKVKATCRVKFETTRFGQVEIDEDNIIRFVEPIPGFPEAKDFVLIPHKEDSPFAWLQSIEFADVAFLVTDPFVFFAKYQPTINEAEIADLEDGSVENTPDGALTVMVILTVPGEPRRMTANLKAPVIINTGNNTAKQVILSSEEYTTKHLLFPDS